ncbi:hypothetical protein QCA50_000916 [Cerrena zonata]|uniref:Putative gamma-glutamylcyclotransferase n=1 Tax=Cerrena zonata TaxID=2478898 RepID=A0AAW0GS61_9APHY
MDSRIIPRHTTAQNRWVPVTQASISDRSGKVHARFRVSRFVCLSSSQSRVCDLLDLDTATKYLARQLMLRGVVSAGATQRMSSHTAFFYGTLIHPSILRRVIGHEGEQLSICPAVLLDHTRHKVKNADYPGVLPFSRSVTLFQGRELTPDEKSVRGTLVSGLSESDVALLDIFEGDEYTREIVSAHPLTSFTPLTSNSSADTSIVPSTAPAIPDLSSLPPPVQAQTYLWAAPTSRLEPDLWEYAQFVRDSAWKWVGDKSRDNQDFIKVDERRAMNGKIISNRIIEDEEWEKSGNC